jgi:TM2 domain-containing membrane protein YozV
MSAGGGSDQKSWLVALLLSLFAGGLGADRFYLGYIGLGVAKLLTGGGCFIWYLIDVIMIAMDKLPDAQGRPLQK